jgi:hypothetical protein
MRRTLTLALAVMSLAALLAVFAGFRTSLKPSARADAALTRLPVPQLTPRSFAFVPNPVKFHGGSSEYLFVRHEHGSLRVYEVPTHRGRFTMPDLQWWKDGGVCRVFEPDFSAKQFRCNDPEATEWVREKLRWSLEGRSLHAGVEDMLSVAGYFSNGEFIVGGQPGG